MSASSSFLKAKMTRRKLLSAGVRLGAGSAAMALGGTGYAAQVEPDWVEIERREIVLTRLPRAFDGFRIAHISDIHIEGGDMTSRFAGVCDLVSAQGTDAIVMTGDFCAYGGTWQTGALFEGFRRLSAKSGVFATLGNHDHRRSGDEDVTQGARVVRAAFERAGVRELPNQAVALRRGDDRLWIAGLDDALTGFADFEALKTQLPGGETTILLHHEPDYADQWAPSGLFDLMLSGHSHGGQIALPFYGPLRLPPMCEIYPRGWYRIGDMQLYTNRGLGTIALPLRFCARPEITLFTLKCA